MELNPYSIFLMIELARVIGVIDPELEYDLTWESGTKLYEEFNLTPFSNFDEPEYECIVEFLNDKIKNRTV